MKYKYTTNDLSVDHLKIWMRAIDYWYNDLSIDQKYTPSIRMGPNEIQVYSGRD